MEREKIDKYIRGKTISVLGLTKNAGKTTTINYLIKKANAFFGRIGVTSIGRDGENKDIVFGNIKPEIFVKRGTIFATTESLLQYCDVSKKIIGSTDFTTPLGDVYVVECMTDGNVQIAGPSVISQMIALKEKMFENGIDCLLIDGAVNRRSLGNASLSEGIILCASANSDSDMNMVINEVIFVSKIFNLPVLENGDSTFRIKGIVTDNVIDKLLNVIRSQEYKTIIFDDPSKIICSARSFKKLENSCDRIGLYSRAKLLAVSVNPSSVYGWGFDSKEFVGKLQEKLNVPVFNVKEGETNIK